MVRSWWMPSPEYEPTEVRLHGAVVTSDDQADGDDGARHRHRDPGPLPELLVDVSNEDAEAQRKSPSVNREPALEAGLEPAKQPIAQHGGLREGERHEHVD